MKNISKVTLIFLLTSVLTGCAGTQTDLSTPPQSDQMELDHIPGANSQIQESTAEVMTGEVIAVEVKNFAYTPKIIRAKSGDTIVVKLTNTEGTHDFVIDELAVQSKMLNEGESEELKIKIPEDTKGKTFEYYCSIGNHRQMGMVGKLIIE